MPEFKYDEVGCRGGGVGVGGVSPNDDLLTVLMMCRPSSHFLLCCTNKRGHEKNVS